jgi:DNA-binding CsgD family transcriptional regulator
VGTRALVVLTKAEAYLRNGVFDPERMFAFWRETAEKARSDGFQRLRATGETDWTVRAAPGLERWIEYESTLNRKFLDLGLFALCQYERRLFPTEVILGVMRAHPIVIFRAAVSRNAVPVSPQQLEPSRFLDGEVKRYFKNLRQRGAMHRAAKERKRELQQTRGKLREAQAALEQAHLGLEAQGVELQKAREPTSSKQADWAALHAMLHPREREVMGLVTSGLLNKEVASLLGLAEITVKTHRRNVMRKMQAASFAELVVIAEALGARVGGMSGLKKPASLPSHR